MAELPTKIHLTLVTRERKVLETDVDEVVLPAFYGALGVLPGHTPLLAELKIGEMTYRVGDKTSSVVISWGFAEILADRVIVIAGGAVLADEINLEEAEKEREEAERLLNSLASHDESSQMAEAKLDQAITAISIARRHHQ